ncbi:MAG TPA: metallophosphoesterase family protein [Gemmatimonadota bacterium]|nr:metallophosphoesterase family protein [Gemmatimonadota bacterium]
MRIGIVSDTHDRILPELFRALAGVDEILHAGDVCTAEALAEIEVIAPVTAVHGNMDERALFERLPEERRLERGGFTIALLHGHRARRGRLEDFVTRYRDSSPDLVVFGHSHEPLSEAVQGTRYFNPGTAGGIGRSPTAGILTIEDGELAVRHVELAG